MKVHRQEAVNPNLPGIIVLSHGPFAVGLVETAEMIFGEQENIAAFSLDAGDDIDMYRETFSKTIEEFPEGSIVCVDLYGGTPFNQLMRYILETGSTPEVLAGVNLPVLIEAVTARSGFKGEALCLDLVENGKEQVMRVDASLMLKDADDDEE